MSEQDTLAAIATATGEGGVSIVRVSGDAAFAVADAVFQGHGAKPSDRPSHVVLHGKISDGDKTVDDVLLLIMKAPRSYTGENVVEIQGHGGREAAKRILRRVIQAGARLAEPGEFTKRAFLNGRIDLLQAEAVLDLVHAKSERAAAAAVEQLEGGLSRLFNELYDRMMTVAADLEATLDFPDDELPPTALPDIIARLKMCIVSADGLLNTWDEGHLLRDGASVVITGLPNVGKSTLLNALLGRDRAIVSPIPGTTRDTIEEGFVLDGIPIRLIDTAGLREADCEVEQEGIRRARAHIRKASLQVYIIDASSPLTDDDQANLRQLEETQTIVMLNKMDLGCKVNADEFGKLTALPCSLSTGRGLAELKEMMRTKLERGLNMESPPHAVIAERHRQLLIEARREVEEALNLLEGAEEEMLLPAANRLRVGLESVGLAIGRTYHDELLSAVFSRFCVGK
jgi:tRNA modification GTPase